MKPAEETQHPSKPNDPDAPDAPGGGSSSGWRGDQSGAGGEAFHLFNPTLVEVGLAEVSLTEQTDGYATCFESAKEKAEESGIHPEESIEAPEQDMPPGNTTPGGAVSEQYDPESDAPEISAPDEPGGGKSDTDPDYPASEQQYSDADISVEAIVETTTMDQGEPSESGEGESQASENEAVEVSPVEQGYASELPSVPLEATVPPQEEAAPLPVSEPADPPGRPTLASEHLALLPDTGGSSQPQHSSGRLIFGFGLIASGVWLRFLANAGFTMPEVRSDPGEHAGATVGERTPPP